MKTRITRTLIAMLLMAITVTANANERSISLKKEDSNSVVLQMDNVEEGTVISIKNKKGKLLFKDKAKRSQYIRKIKLNTLESGQLSLELENDASLEVLPIEVSNSFAEIKKNQSEVYVKPIVRVQQEQLQLFLRADHQGYYIKMTDRFGDTVYREEISTEDHGLKRYDVSNLPRGRYNIKFKAAGRSFNQSIYIK